MRTLLCLFLSFQVIIFSAIAYRWFQLRDKL